METIVSSGTRELRIGGENPFCIIGERINPTGRKIFQEEVVNEVLEQLMTDGAPRFVEVEGEFAARGGMTTRVVASSGELPQSWISG